MATHIECEAAQYASSTIFTEGKQSPNSTRGELLTSLWDFCKRFVYYWYRLTLKYFIVVLNVTFLIGFLMCFYIPGFQELNGSDHDNYESSKNATAVLFAFTFLALVANGIYLYFLHDSTKSTESIRRWTWVAFFHLIIVLGLAATLLNISQGHNPNSSHQSTSGSDSDLSYSWDRFTCGCYSSTNDTSTPIPTIAPTVSVSAIPTFEPTPVPSLTPTGGFPTLQPTEYLYPNRYEFECSNDLFDNVNGDVCQVNCGVCASTYRDPFIAYAFLGAVYFAIICVIMHYEFYIADQLDFFIPTLFHSKKVVNLSLSDLIVTVHGSRAFGYPIHTKMTLQDYLPFEERINQLVQSDKDRRSGDILRHFAGTGTYSMETKPRSSWFWW